MKVFSILMALLLVPAVAVWSAGCDDAPESDNGGNGGDGGSGANGGTGGGGTGG
ncbi:MAG: hypothetical protein JRE81_12485, partial [Deltaproteobacteria bacterium]|nr:hypothetical protein [Deltaproteobacteria bacterium]